MGFKKFIYREMFVKDNVVLLIPENALCISIHVDPKDEIQSRVSWLEPEQE